MSQAFRDKADAIYKHLTSKVKPMGLNGIVFDGTLLTAYIDNLVNQINEGALPNIEPVYIYICRTKCH